MTNRRGKLAAGSSCVVNWT